MRVRALVVAFAVLAATSCGGASEPASDGGRLGPVQLVEELRDGGYVIYLRHALTDRSKEDDPALDFRDCTTQRNLSEEGRDQAREIGGAFRALGIPLGDVRSSEYCRTRETAELAFGEATVDRAVTSLPHETDPGYDAAVARTRELLAEEPREANTVLVGHIKNIEAAAGISIEEGELAVFEPRGGEDFVYRGRIPPELWDDLVDELG